MPKPDHFKSFSSHGRKFNNCSPIKILLVTRVIPVENSTGARAYLIDFLSYLKTFGFEIELALLDSSPGGKSPVFMTSSKILNLCKISLKNNYRLGRFLFRFESFLDLFAMPFGLLYYLLPNSKRDIYRNLCYSTLGITSSFFSNHHTIVKEKPQIKDKLASPSEKAFVRTCVENFRPQIIIINYAWLSGVLDVLPMKKTILKILLTHDIIHKRVKSAENFYAHWDYSTWDSKKESSLLQKADILLAIHEDDAKVLKSMAPMTEVICMPISAELHTQSFEQIPGRCLFVGSKGETNVHGLKWFLTHVWPSILNSVPHCSLHVCGTVCSKIRGSFPNVTLMGRIDDLGPEYSAAEVCLVPLHFGSGLKIKLIEALSYGRACVSTSIGLQGLNDIKDKIVLMADTTEDFASAVIMVLTNKAFRNYMAHEAEKFVREKFSPKAVYQPFVDRIYDHLCKIDKLTVVDV